MTIRTRFAPSPTGFLHVGGARTALFSWAYARRHAGKFILRIEDTDLERSTRQSVDAILDGLRWLGIDWDEGPFFQMQRLPRYREVAEQLVSSGKAYRCYCTREELDRMREEQRAKGEKPRYNGKWRDSKEKPPAGVPPVIRFRNPPAGEVKFQDEVKGEIKVENSELDDLVLLRADGVPTYNFGVVVDDLDMGITHVIRGDDHVNNTPRQINIFSALEKKPPVFAHVPMILGHDGERLSKRHGAVSVTQYRDDGFLPEALLNYLARLGWSHGDEEIFPKDAFVGWFDLAHVSRSAARFDPEKLAWLNQHYLKQAPDDRLAGLVEPELRKLGVDPGAGPPLAKAIPLFKERATTIPHLAEAAAMLYRYDAPPKERIAAYLEEPKVRAAVHAFEAALGRLALWDRAGISGALSATLKSAGIKMKDLAMPVRALVTGREQTPSLDAVLELIGRERVLSRLSHYLSKD